MKFIFTTILALFPILASAQCCPYINGVEVIPANPTTTDNIKIVTTTTTPNQGLFLYSTFAVNGNTIDIEACYYSGMLTATQTYFDTLTIGMLPAGNYSVDFTAFEASDTICNYSDSTAMNTNFTVTDGTNGLPVLSQELIKIYPNPSSGNFKVDVSDELNIARVTVRSISGTIVFQGNYSNEFQLDLQSGTYFIELLENDVIRGYSRLMID